MAAFEKLVSSRPPTSSEIPSAFGTVKQTFNMFTQIVQSWNLHSQQIIFKFDDIRHTVALIIWEADMQCCAAERVLLSGQPALQEQVSKDGTQVTPIRASSVSGLGLPSFQLGETKFLNRRPKFLNRSFRIGPQVSEAKNLN